MAIRRLLIFSGLALALGGCSSLVSADRSKIPDSLYRPTPDGGADTDGPATEAGEGEDGGAPGDAVSGGDGPTSDSGVDAGGDTATGQ